jgi:hypothetical protein
MERRRTKVSICREQKLALLCRYAERRTVESEETWSNIGE